jgi:hypothetical protein
MWAQGWNKKSIAGCLKLSRRQVGRIIEIFEREALAGRLNLFFESPAPFLVFFRVLG